MMSQEERERAYGIQEKSLKQLYIKALKLNSSSSDAVKLLQCSEEDLPNKIAEIMKSRSSEGSLSVFEVDSALSYFSDNQRMALQENELCRIILGSTAIDQKWFAKMILKRMDLKVGTMKILKFYHPKAHELFLKFNHLTRVVQLIESGQAENSLIEVTKVFEPIRSMLCQKFSSNSNKSFLEKEIYQETKMDGERFQLHMKDGEFRYFSRNGHDFSAGFNTLLTPLIKFSSVVHSIILDGEMLVYDKNQRRYHTKGETTIDVKHMKDVASNLRPCFCAFDILFFNDQNFMNRQYNERNQLLSQIFDDREGVLVKTAPIKIRNIDHMVDLFNKAMENEEEGIVLKDAESIYKPGERTGGWFKVKPDYFDGAMVKEFDCIIIGGYFANPHKKNYLQRYMLGVVEKQADNDAFNVYAVGEVVHGVSVQERMKINDNLKPHMVDHCGEKEVSFGFGKIFFGKNKPDVWVPPNKSIVLECKASELAKNWEQFTEYTFRFPRISNVRRDKIWEECCTLKEFQDMCASDDGKVKKVAIRNANRDDLTSPTRKRKALASKASVIAQFCNKDDEFEDVKVLDNVLDGKEFCVMTTNPKLPSIKEMKMMIKTHGGSLTQFPRKGKTFAIIAGEMTKMVQSFMNEKIFNVIKAHWLVQNFPNEALTEMPRIRPVIDLVFATDTLKESLKQIFDEFGDSFTDAIQSEDQLKALMSTMKNISTPSVCDFTELDMELSSFGTKNLNIFRDVTAAFEQSENENFLFNSAKSIFKFRAGEIVELHDMRQASLLIVDKNVNELKIEYLDYNAIDFHWILDSSDAGKLLDKKKYFVDI